MAQFQNLSDEVFMAEVLCDSCSVLLEQPVVLYEATGKRGRATFVVCSDCRRLLRSGESLPLTLHYEDGASDRQPFRRKTPKVICDGCGMKRMDISRWEVDDSNGSWAMVCDDCEDRLNELGELAVTVHKLGHPDERIAITKNDKT